MFAVFNATFTNSYGTVSSNKGGNSAIEQYRTAVWVQVCVCRGSSKNSSDFHVMLCIGVIYEGHGGSVPHSLEWKVRYFTFITFVPILVIVSCKCHKNRSYRERGDGD